MCKVSQMNPWTRGHPEVSDLPEAIVAGNLTAELQRLEQQLLEQSHKHRNTDHHDIAATLHELGQVSQAAGDLPEAKRYLEESFANEALSARVIEITLALPQHCMRWAE